MISRPSLVGSHDLGAWNRTSGLREHPGSAGLVYGLIGGLVGLAGWLVVQ